MNPAPDRPDDRPDDRARFTEARATRLAVAIAVGAVVLTLAFEATDAPRDDIAVWYWIVFPFAALAGDVVRAVAGQPTDPGFVRRGVRAAIAFHLVLALIQAVFYLVPDLDFVAPSSRHSPLDVEAARSVLIPASHLAGLLFGPLITGLARRMRQMWPRSHPAPGSMV